MLLYVMQTLLYLILKKVLTVTLYTVISLFKWIQLRDLQ